MLCHSYIMQLHILQSCVSWILNRLNEHRRVWALFKAVKDDDQARLQELLQKGGEPNPVYYQKLEIPTPLYKNMSLIQFACNMNRHLCVKMLIEAGVDVDLRVQCGITPLMYSCVSNAYDTAELLCALGTNVNAKCDAGMCAFDYSNCMSADAVKFLRLLLQHGLDVKTIDKKFLYAGLCNKTYKKEVITILQSAGVVFHVPVYSEPQNLIDIAKVRIRDAIVSGNCPNMFLGVSELKLPKPLGSFLLNNVDIDKLEWKYWHVLS